MAGLIVTTPPICEPVPLATVKNYLRVDIDDDDDKITLLMTAAREYAETFTNRCFIKTGLLQNLDNFPYYDNMYSLTNVPPGTFPVPKYASTVWNYSQMIKVLKSNLLSVDNIQYVYTNGVTQTLNGDTSGTAEFAIDENSQPGRIFPLPGQFWPSVLYVPNAVSINFWSGYGKESVIKSQLATQLAAWQALNPGASQQQIDAESLLLETSLRQAVVPAKIKLAIMALTAHWYEHPESVSDINLKEAPQSVDTVMWAERILDLSPTRG